MKVNYPRTLGVLLTVCGASILGGTIVAIFDLRGLALLLLGGFGGLATLNVVLFTNLRKHMDIQHRAILSTQAAVSLSRVKIDYPTFFINHAVAPDFLQILAEILRRNSVSNVLELGSGTSSLYIAALLQQYGGEGNVISLEDSQEWAVLVQRELDAIGIPNVHSKVIHAPLILQRGTSSSFYDFPESTVSEITPIDLIVVDGPGDTRLRIGIFSAMERLLAPSTIFIFDDGDSPHIQQGVQDWIHANPAWTARKYSTVKGTWVVWNQEHSIPLPLP